MPARADAATSLSEHLFAVEHGSCRGKLLWERQSLIARGASSSGSIASGRRNHRRGWPATLAAFRAQLAFPAVQFLAPGLTVFAGGWHSILLAARCGVHGLDIDS